MRWSLLLITLSFFTFSSVSQAALFLTGSVNQSSTNMGLQSSDTRGGSASIDIGLGSYVRVGITHQQSFTQAGGYTEDADIEDEEDPELIL